MMKESPYQLLRSLGGMKEWWRFVMPDLSGGYRSDNGDGIRNAPLLIVTTWEDSLTESSENGSILQLRLFPRTTI